MNSAAMLSGDPYWAGIDMRACGVGDDYRQLAQARGGRVCPHETDRPLTLTMMTEQGVAPRKAARHCTMELITPKPGAVQDPTTRKAQKQRIYYNRNREQRTAWQRAYRLRKKGREMAPRQE